MNPTVEELQARVAKLEGKLRRAGDHIKHAKEQERINGQLMLQASKRMDELHEEVVMKNNIITDLNTQITALLHRNAP